MEILSADMLIKGLPLQIESVLDNYFIEELPNFIFQFVNNGYFVNNKFVLCEHEYEFIGIVGDEHCCKCQKWYNYI